MSEYRISATELARELSGVLDRIRRLGDSFVVEREGEPVARVGPLTEGAPTGLRDALTAWSSAGAPDPSFAADLEVVDNLDVPPEGAWAS